MRIAFLTPSVGEAFGQEQVLHETVRLLESTGHSCHVLSENQLGPIPSYVQASLFPDLSLVNTLSSRQFVNDKHTPVMKRLNDFAPDLVHFVDLFDYRLLNDITEKYPSVLTAHSVSHTCPASHRLLKSNRSCDAQSGWGCMAKDFSEGCLSHFKSPLHKLHGIQNFLLKKEIVSRRMKKIIAISHYMKSVMVKDGYNPDQIEVIYNPVREQTGLKPKNIIPNLIVCAARLVPLKGVDHFIRALTHLKDTDFKAWIFGDGPERERLDLLTKKLGLEEKVVFKGKTPRAELQESIRNAQLLVQTNLGPEGFGLSVAESMLLGTPVVSYDIAALNELVVNNETGFLCTVGDEKTLAMKLKEILSDAHLRTDLSENGLKRAREIFSCQKFLTKTENVYLEAVGAATSTESKILSSSFA